MTYDEKEIQNLAEEMAGKYTISNLKKFEELYDSEVTNLVIELRMYMNMLGLEPNERETAIKFIKRMYKTCEEYEMNLKYLYVYEQAIKISEEAEDSE